MFRPEFQTRFWLVAVVAVAVVLWLLEPVLLPFIAGMAIAYFLHPVVDKLVRRGMPRWLVALMVLGGFAAIITLILILVGPLLVDQIGALIDAAPGYIEKARARLIPWFETNLERFSPEDAEKIRDAAGQYAGDAAGIAGKALRSIITSGLALIDILALLIITPVVAFYLMRDWPLVTAAIDSFIPRRHYDVVKAQLMEIDSSLSGFMRGQALVCLTLGFYYSLGLTIVGLQYGAAIGLIAGVLSFIPYVGSAFAIISSLVVALVQFDNVGRVVTVASVLMLGQILEGYVLTPRLVGQRVGLHPVWILFAIIAGGRLMGFAGILIAVPAAAVIGVLTRFAIGRYKRSSLYKDQLAPVSKT